MEHRDKVTQLREEIALVVNAGHAADTCMTISNEEDLERWAKRAKNWRSILNRLETALAELLRGVKEGAV